MSKISEAYDRDIARHKKARAGYDSEMTIRTILNKIGEKVHPTLLDFNTLENEMKKMSGAEIAKLKKEYRNNPFALDVINTIVEISDYSEKGDKK